MALPSASSYVVIALAAVATVVCVGYLVFLLVDIVFCRPLRDLIKSIQLALASGELTYVRPVPKSRSTRSLQAIFHTDEEIEKIAAVFEQALSANKKAKEAIACREREHLEWLGYLSHDLGAPLGRILKRLEVLEYDANLNPPAKERLLNAIHIEVTQVAELIASISRFAVLDSDIDRSFQQTDIVPLLEYAVEVFECEASKKGIELDLRVEKDIGFVRIERSLIRRAVENILANAIRHTPEGGLVSVGVERLGATVSIRIADTGVGIPETELQKIFEFAFRGEGHTRITEMGSIGLGLALVRRVAEIHSGHVMAHNLKPQGAEFVLSLPIFDETLSGTQRDDIAH
jgi:two-component system phosphate regulon sensor histidine kinase PhoR